MPKRYTPLAPASAAESPAYRTLDGDYTGSSASVLAILGPAKSDARIAPTWKSPTRHPAIAESYSKVTPWQEGIAGDCSS
ncbi:MAG: hypothetical protein OXI87_03730 [Albidovulum sp.]|nr:hypothetical protein [Albidovulum sp.]